MNTDALLEEVKKEIKRLEKVVNLLEGSSSTAKPRRRRRKFSAEARKRIGDAQRKRWAKKKAEKAS